MSREKSGTCGNAYGSAHPEPILLLMGKRMRHLKRAVLCAAVAAAIAEWGCAPKKPVVAREYEPWEEVYARAMIQPEAFLPTPSPTPPGLIHTHPVPRGAEEPGPSQAAAQLIGAPFRGIGWLIRAIF